MKENGCGRPSIDYTVSLQDEELRDLCLNCKKNKCKYGICEDWKNAWRELHGISRMKKGGCGGKAPKLHYCNGERKSMQEWSEATGIPVKTLVSRTRRGLPLEEAIRMGTKRTWRSE